MRSPSSRRTNRSVAPSLLDNDRWDVRVKQTEHEYVESVVLCCVVCRLGSGVTRRRTSSWMSLVWA